MTFPTPTRAAHDTSSSRGDNNATSPEAQCATDELAIETISAFVQAGPDQDRRLRGVSDRITIGTAPSNDLVLTDPSVSGYHLEVSRDGLGLSATDLGSTNGTYFSGARLSRAVVPTGSTLQLGRTKIRFQDGPRASVRLHDAAELSGLVGQSAAMRRTMAELEETTLTPGSVLLVGESGTGKGIAAHTYHRLSERAAEPIVTVDCGAVHPDALAAELFGRDALSDGGQRELGALERAHGGTLFLDAIFELSLGLQSELSAVLARGAFRPLGAHVDRPLDVQLVCASNRDLRREVNRRRFRLDLYTRIADRVLHLPTLRDRPEDIPMLIDHFSYEYGHDLPAHVSGHALRALLEHPWPGNVRQLKRWVETTLDSKGAPTSRHGRVKTLSDAVNRLSYEEARVRWLHELELRSKLDDAP